ncbi:MAG TPA: oligopeptide/dipeptide ABC transporter ATP-binding protein [Verrucomicrobiae bacterium]|nr:oligopeptide/dipeptide ABC transporter ATP-binding protein [Verrucomicrobiae bacterium]
MDRSPALLEVQGLTIQFRAGNKRVEAVSDVAFSLRPGEILGIVGESGSGKTQILMSMMGLLAANGRSTGSVKLRGEEILNLTTDKLDQIRGSVMTMIFQDPMTSLNPFMRVGKQLTEVLVKHRGIGGQEAVRQATAMLEHVRIPEAERRMSMYPHEFSGGMRQRAMIAMSLLCRPALLLADEPTTALDVTVQAQILTLIRDLARESGTSVVLVTHDLGVVADLCDRVIVLYGGRIMEDGPIDDVFYDPKHPYTKGLLRSMPRLDEKTHGELPTIPGQPPILTQLAGGCPFEPRCALRQDYCKSEVPPLARSGLRRLACHEVSL